MSQIGRDVILIFGSLLQISARVSVPLVQDSLYIK